MEMQATPTEKGQAVKTAISRKKFNPRSIKGLLIITFMVVCVILSVMVVSNIVLIGKVNDIMDRIANVRVPTSNASLSLKSGINESLAALRGYMLLGKDNFKEDRTNAWNTRITPAVENLNRLSKSWTNKENVERLKSITSKLETFRKYQDEIEGIAQTTTNDRALYLLNTEITPLTETIYTTITNMIDEELQIQGNKDGKKLLGMMADIRGTASMSFARMREFVLTGDDKCRKTFDQLWQKNALRFSELSANSDKLTAHQKEYLQELTEARNKFDAAYTSVFESKLDKTSNKANYLLATNAAPVAKAILTELEDMVKSQEELLTQDTDQADVMISNMHTTEYVLLICGIIVCVVLGTVMMRQILTPVYRLRDYILELGRGQLPEALKISKDEIGEMIQAINLLVSNLTNVKHFALEVGQGKFDTEINVFNDQGDLGASLAEMRDSLKRVAEEDKKRNWANEGLAKFGEILRTSNDDLVTLSYTVTSNLVKYLKANQGALFIINNEGDKPCMELVAAYAYERKKYLSRRIELGEGLVGQAWHEKEVIYLTDVPEDYVNITSGLGDGSPRSILIMPLKVNNEIFGAVELASFNTLSKHEIDFVEKLSESVASTISSVKVNERTKKLLLESQQQSEELKAQEEEMRQNMEEMQATQEEMQRKELEMKSLLKELKDKEENARATEEELRQNLEEMQATQEEMKRIQQEMEAQMNIINKVAIVSKTDLRGNIIYANDEFLKLSKYTREELIGKNHRILKSGHQPDEIFAEMWKTISSGKIFRGEIKNKAKDGTYYWVDAVIAPILDANGKPKEYIAQRFVINDKKQKEEELAQLREKQAQCEKKHEELTEQLKQAREELEKYKG